MLTRASCTSSRFRSPWQVVSRWRSSTCSRSRDRFGSRAWLEGPASDDAFYYFSIARNLPPGEGLTASAGLPTNGFQPLYLGVSYLAGQAVAWDSGNLPAAMYFLNWLGLSGSVSSSPTASVGWSYPSSGRHVAASRRRLVAFTPALRLTTNGMETAFVLTAWSGTSCASSAGTCSLGRCFARPCSAGAGSRFLVRNDAFALISAVGVYMLVTLARGPGPLPKQLAPLALTAGVTALLAAPWLISNLVRFGQLVPQSGAAEAIGGLYDAGRLKQVVAVVLALARNLCPLPLPHSTGSPRSPAP